MPQEKRRFLDRIYVIVLFLWAVGFWVLFFRALPQLSAIFTDASMGFLWYPFRTLVTAFTPVLWLLFYSFGTFVVYRSVFSGRSVPAFIAIGLLVTHALFFIGYWFGLFAIVAGLYEFWEWGFFIRFCSGALLLLGPSLGLQSYLLARSLRK